MPPRGVKRKALTQRWTAAKKAATAAARAAVSATARRSTLGVRRGYRGTVALGRGPIPQKITTTLKYREYFTVAGTVFDTLFNANSLFDPYYGVGGHQPMGFDQYATFFTRYRVLSCKIVVTCLVKTATVPLMFGVVADNSVNAYTSMTDAPEQQKTAFKTVTPYGGPGTATLTKKWNLWTVTGVTESTYKSDDRYAGTVSANPSEQIMYHVIYANSGGSALTSGDCSFIVDLEFHTEFFDAKQLGGS